MIDTHLHLWRLSTGWYAWNTPDLGAVHADAELAEVAPEMERAGVSAAVVVQAADTLAETDWLLELADREDRIAGVVGYLPLDDPLGVEELVAGYGGSGLVGVRQLWHDHDHPALADEAVLRSLRLLGEAGLAVDVPDAFPGVWDALAVAARAAPDTTFVLDHCGKPPFGDRRAWVRWESAFCELVARPNLMVKLSGLFGGSGSGGAPGRAELERVVAVTRTVAGERTMIGSDWPMTRGRLGYAATLDRLDGLLADWSAGERELALTGAAQATYRLAVP